MSKASNKLVEKLKVLREELNWFYSRLNRTETEETDEINEIYEKEVQENDK